MSLDTVLQIGKALRTAENNLKYFRYVASCPNGNNGNEPIRITIPVKTDFTFDWENVTHTNENQWENLYYLKFKTSDQDTSANKYLFGDIYYGRSTKNKEFGNYHVLKKKDAFHNGLDAYKEIVKDIKESYISQIAGSIADKIDRDKVAREISKSHKSGIINPNKNLKKYQTLIESGTKGLNELIKHHKLILFHEAFERNIKLFNNLLCHAKVCESIIINEPKKFKEYLVKDNKSESNQTQENTNFSVFIHFDFYDEHISWYQIEDAFAALKRKLDKETTRETKEGLVPSKSIYRTLCSGNQKNDIQYPSFDYNAAYKSFAFKSQEQFDDFLYTGEILNPTYKLDETSINRKLHGTNINMFIFPVAIEGTQISASEYELFFKTKNEKAVAEDIDPLFSILHDENRKRFSKFDFVLSDCSGKTPRDLVEISGIERSNLSRIEKRMREVAFKEYNERRGYANTKDLPQKIEHALLNVLGAYSANGIVTANERYESHILKTVTAIYTENYYQDEMLLPTFIKNMEFLIRSIKKDDTPGKYNFLKCDLYFLIGIQNSETDKIERMKELESYKIGLGLGNIAKPLRNKINSFEKRYVGLLTRHVGTKDDCIKFANEINEMLVRHEKVWMDKSADVCKQIANIPPGEYDKEKLALGFFEGYFTYEVAGTLKELVSSLKNTISKYEGLDSPEVENAIDELNNTIAAIEKTIAETNKTN